MRKTTVLENRIRVRAYYIALNSGFTIDPTTAWLCAEYDENARGARRSAAVAKGNHTRALKRAAMTAQTTARLRNEMRTH